jgi:hypothetical protein
VGLGQKQVTKGTSTTSYPDWYTDAAKTALTSFQNFASSPATPYTGQRVAATSPMSQDAITQMGGLQAPAASTERIVDENGKLGAINDYLNPYTKAALDPALREIDLRASQEQHRIGAMRQGTGGYGDARHGVLEGAADRQHQIAIGDTTAKTMAAGYDSAMGLRQQDLSRFTQQDQQAFQNTIAAVQAKLAAGQLTQQQAQNELDAQYAEFMRLQQDKYDKISALGGGLGAINPGSTTTETGPRGFPLIQAVGSAVGSWF